RSILSSLKISGAGKPHTGTGLTRWHGIQTESALRRSATIRSARSGTPATAPSYRNLQGTAKALLVSVGRAMERSWRHAARIKRSASGTPIATRHWLHYAVILAK